MSTGSAGDSRDAIRGSLGGVVYFFNRRNLRSFLEEYLASGNKDATYGKVVTNAQQHSNLRLVDLDALTPQQANVMLHDINNGGGPWG